MLDKELSKEAKKVLARLSNQENIIEYKKLDFRRDKDFGFSYYRSLKELFKAIYYRNFSIDNSERIQGEYEATLTALEKYRPRNPDYPKARENLLINAKNLYDWRQVIIDAFKNKIFPFGVEEPDDSGKRPDESDESDESDDEFYTPRELETIPELSNFENEETLRDMPNLESEESAAERKNIKGKGLEILTPQQMLRRLPSF